MRSTISSGRLITFKGQFQAPQVPATQVSRLQGRGGQSFCLEGHIGIEHFSRGPHRFLSGMICLSKSICSPEKGNLFENFQVHYNFYILCIQLQTFKSDLGSVSVPWSVFFYPKIIPLHPCYRLAMPICMAIPQYNAVKKLFREQQKVPNCPACMGTLNNSTHIQYVLRSVTGHGKTILSLEEHFH